MTSVQPETKPARPVMPSATPDVRADLTAKAQAIIARYPAGKARSALLPMLHLVQSADGYVSPEGVAFCAETLGLTKAEVGGVATFYTMYKRRPVGEYLVSVCTNTMCGVLGGQKAYDTLAEHLGVGHDQTTPDGKITLEHAECLAACDYAPVMTVNYEFYDQIDADSALGLVKRLESGERPQPTRGARLCSFKETSLQLAGFLDERDGANADGPAGEPTLAGNRLAERTGVSVPGFDPNTPIKPVPPKAAPASPAAKAPTVPTPAKDSKPAGDDPAPARAATPSNAPGPTAGATSNAGGTANGAVGPANPATSPATGATGSATGATGSASGPAETSQTSGEKPAAEAFTYRAPVEGSEPYGAGSKRVASGAGAPEGFTIKGNEDSGLYHGPASPSYKRTVAEVWFDSIETAEAAGFVAWNAPADVRAARKRAAKEGKK